MKGYIYKIYDNTNGNVYYGSTKQLLCKRIGSHRKDYKKYLNGKANYIKSYDILKNNDYSYCVVEEVEYQDKHELLNRERYYIENFECVNKNIPNRTNKEWNKENKDKIKKYHKEYYENNKDIFKEYRDDNKDKINKYQKEYNKEYYEKNKDIVNEIKKEKIICECGCNVRSDGISRHKKTKKHLLYLETLQ